MLGSTVAAEVTPAAGAEAPPRRPHVRREATVVGVVALCTYGLTLSAVPALTHDSLTYVEAIEQGGAALFHPHHLGYNALARAWLDVAQGLGFTGDPLRVIAMLDAVLGACAASLIWSVLRLRAGLPRSLAAVGTAGAGLSFGMWFYSVSVEVYLLPLVLLLATFFVLSGPTLSPGRMAAVGALHGLAVLGHQINVLFAVVVLLAAARRVPRATALRRLVAFGTTTTAVILAGYASVLALVVRPDSASQARSWFTHYAESGAYWDVGPSAPAKAAVGLARSIIGGHFAFRLDWVRDRMLAAFPDRSLTDESFLVRNVPSSVAWVFTALAGLALVLTVVTVARGIRRRSEVPETSRRVLQLLVVWFLTYTAFFLFWDADNVEFWIPQTTVMWMAAVTLWAPADRAPADRPVRTGTIGLGIAAGLVATVNLLGTILPATDVENDIYARRYLVLDDLADEGDLVIVEYPHLGVPYTSRLTDATAISRPHHSPVIELDEEEEPSIPQFIEIADDTLANGDRVVIDAVLIDRPDNSATRALAHELERHFGGRWHPVEVQDADGWLVVEGSSPPALQE